MYIRNIYLCIYTIPQKSINGFSFTNSKGFQIVSTYVHEYISVFYIYAYLNGYVYALYIFYQYHFTYAHR
jgi:hypothetical protein